MKLLQCDSVIIADCLLQCDGYDTVIFESVHNDKNMMKHRHDETCVG